MDVLRKGSGNDSCYKIPLIDSVGYNVFCIRRLGRVTGKHSRRKQSIGKVMGSGLQDVICTLWGTQKRRYTEHGKLSG